MSRKILIKIFGLSLVAGFLFILGTAGLSDCDLIDFKTILVRCGIGLLLMLIGLVGLKVNDCEYND